MQLGAAVIMETATRKYCHEQLTLMKELDALYQTVEPGPYYKEYDRIQELRTQLFERLSK